MNLPVLNLFTIEIRYEHDIVLVRQRARQVASLLEFDSQDAVRVATAVSEIARNAFQYAGGGRAEFALERLPKAALLISVRDSGPGIAHVEAILQGRYVSQTGMGVGLIGAKRLMDRLTIETPSGGGTLIRMAKTLPIAAQTVTPQRIAHITEELAQRNPQNPFEEMQQQNQELLRTLTELRARQTEVERLNGELEETNRGVMALYAELDDRAEALRLASESKTRFLAHMSHEFRTPLTAIISLARLLTDRTDGNLTQEQERQTRLIDRSARDLMELVNDLLDIAKIEAGRTTITPDAFTTDDLFGALRGMFRPLLPENGVELLFEPPVPPLSLFTDEAKVAQILRNFISNALKFTPSGEIRVGAVIGSDEIVYFSVADTGIGIAADHQQMIFEEFAQVDGPYQLRAKGTGLGLPLCRRLAELLGGKITLESKSGVGSTFTAALPLVAPSSAGHDPSSLPMTEALV